MSKYIDFDLSIFAGRSEVTAEEVTAWMLDDETVPRSQPGPPPAGSVKQKPWSSKNFTHIYSSTNIKLIFRSRSTVSRKGVQMYIGKGFLLIASHF